MFFFFCTLCLCVCAKRKYLLLWSKPMKSTSFFFTTVYDDSYVASGTFFLTFSIYNNQYVSLLFHWKSLVGFKLHHPTYFHNGLCLWNDTLLFGLMCVHHDCLAEWIIWGKSLMFKIAQTQKFHSNWIWKYIN